MAETQLPDVLTKEQVAELVQCEVWTVEEAARNGTLPSVKLGRGPVFPREALMKRLNEMALVRRATRAEDRERRERVRKDTLRQMTIVRGKLPV